MAASFTHILHIRLQPPSHTAAASFTYGCSLLHVRLQVLAFQSQLVGNVDLAIPGRLFVRQASLIKLRRDGPTTYAAYLLYTYCTNLQAL